MNTRLLMRASAVFLGVLGAAATFLPQEILARAGGAPVGFSVELVQTTGALYLGFAMLNWMAQVNLVGGIYGRPVTIGNLVHFTIAALALLKSVLAGQRAEEVIVAAVAYTAFAILFAAVAFGRPPRARTDA